MDERFMENAAALELLHREAAIDNARHPAPEAARMLFDGAHCVEPDCEDEIPAARLATGAIRCIDCQRAKEAKHAPH